MSEMIDRVAKAMWETYPQAVLREPWEDMSVEQRSEVISEARAAIEAMKEPTLSMRERWACSGDKTFILRGQAFVHPEGAWRIGIEEALHNDDRK
jgi:hypothetical protein